MEDIKKQMALMDLELALTKARGRADLLVLYKDSLHVVSSATILLQEDIIRCQALIKMLMEQNGAKGKEMGENPTKGQ